MNTEQRLAWLESRRSGIGSSDVAKIIGLSKWGSALNVYLDKVMPAKEEKLEPRLEWGIRKEPVIASAIVDHFGWTLSKVPLLRHADHPFLIANIDRENQDQEPCEIKTAERSDGWGEAETSEVPDYYWTQAQHQIEVKRSLGFMVERCWIFVLIGQGDFRRYSVPHDPEYMPTVFDSLNELWRCVENRTPPEPDWSHPKTLEAIQRMCVPSPGVTIELSQAEKSLADDYVRLGEEIKIYEQEREETKTKLIAAMGESELGNLPDGRSIVRNLVNRKGHEVKPSSYYSFSVKKAKGAK